MFAHCLRALAHRSHCLLFTHIRGRALDRALALGKGGVLRYACPANCGDQSVGYRPDSSSANAIRRCTLLAPDTGPNPSHESFLGAGDQRIVRRLPAAGRADLRGRARQLTWLPRASAQPRRGVQGRRLQGEGGGLGDEYSSTRLLSGAFLCELPLSFMWHNIVLGSIPSLTVVTHLL